jgi:hypothetical protein
MNKKERLRKQEEAKIRQESYDKLSPIAKLHKLGGYRATKQRKKLEAQIHEEG